MEFVIARTLGRTRAELLDPDNGISTHELTWQKALLLVEAEEREEQSD